MLRRTHACLNRAVRRAMARHLVKRNVVELAEIPSGRDGRPSKSLTPQHVDAVHMSTAPDRMHHYIVLSLLTVGVPRGAGPALGACPSRRSPGPSSSAAAVRRVWHSVRPGGDTKTRRSRRTLALPARCVETLRKQRAQQAADRLAAGDRWQDTGLVFTTALGSGMAAASIRRDCRRALRLNPGIDASEWTPRELRYSFVSVLFDAGVPLEEISRLVGNSGTTATEPVYRHQLKPVIQTGARVMNQLFKAKGDPA